MLAELSAGLRGPRRIRADLLTELRDGLDDATNDLLTSGIDVQQARHVAAAEFGDPAVLARQLQVELTGAQARRTALAVALGSALLETAWSVGYPTVMRDYGMRGGYPTPSWFLAPLNTFQEIMVWTVTPLLLLAYLLMFRRTVALRRVAALVGLLAGGLLTITFLASGLMTAFNPSLREAVQGNPIGLMLQVGTVIGLAFLVLSTARTVRLLGFTAEPLPRRE